MGVGGRSRRDRRERKGAEEKGVGGTFHSTRRHNMGGNVSRGIRHSHRDGGGGPRSQAVKGGVTPGENKMPPRLELLLDMPTVHRDTQVKHAWNSELKFRFFYVL